MVAEDGYVIGKHGHVRVLGFTASKSVDVKHDEEWREN